MTAQRLELTGESRRQVVFVNNGDNTCEIRISGPFASSAEAVLGGGAMRALQNWLATGLEVPCQSPVGAVPETRDETEKQR